MNDRTRRMVLSLASAGLALGCSGCMSGPSVVTGTVYEDGMPVQQEAVVESPDGTEVMVTTEPNESGSEAIQTGTGGDGGPAADAFSP